MDFMSWIIASLFSAFFLGCYDLCTKHAVRDNAVLPVLFLSTLSGAAVWAVLLLVHAASPPLLPFGLTADPITPVQHLQRALILLAERPTWLQGLGIATTLASFVTLSFASRREGIHFHRDKWVGFMAAGTLLGAVSSLYDKYLLGTLHFRASTVQAWFSIYLVILFLPLVIGWKLQWWQRNEFHWRWTIPVIAFALLVADYVYFGALRDKAALVSVVTSLRRGSTLVAFAGGLLFFNEKNGLQKLPAVLGVFVGIALTILG